MPVIGLKAKPVHVPLVSQLDVAVPVIGLKAKLNGHTHQSYHNVAVPVIGLKAKLCQALPPLGRTLPCR